MENQLRRWIPRRPNPALEARLFGERKPGRPPARRISAWTWWAPALGGLMVAAVVLNERARSPLGAEGYPLPEPAARFGWISRNLASYEVFRQHSDLNAPPTFKWTSNNRSASSNGSFLLLETNGLVR